MTICRKAVRFAAAAAAVMAIACAAPAEDAPHLTEPEQVTLPYIAVEWGELSQWCALNKLAKRGRYCIERAQAANPDASWLKAFRACVDKALDQEKPGALREWETKRAAACRKIAAFYDKMISAISDRNDPKVRARVDGYLLDVLEAVPDEKRWKAVLDAVEAVVGSKETGRACDLAQRAIGLAPPKEMLPRFKEIVDLGATEKVLLRQASTHPIKYYFSLPKEYKREKDRKWPALICVDGSGCDYAGMANGFKRVQGDLPFIIAVPCTFSNTGVVYGAKVKIFRSFYTDELIKEGSEQGVDWDEKGILAIIKDLQADYDVEDRVYVTGFSAGGYAAYMMVFRHPDLLNGAAPACACFGGDYDRFRDQFDSETLSFPLHVIYGGKDNSVRVSDEEGKKRADDVLAFIKDMGYSNVKLTIVPEMGHSRAHEQVVETFRPYWEGKKKRGDRLE